MNDENLIPFSKRTPEELKEIGRKGGVASGKKRRKNRRMKELFEIAATLPAKADYKKFYNDFYEIDEDDVDNEQAYVARLWDDAWNGVESARRIVLRMLGEDDELNERIRSNKENEKIKKAELKIKTGEGQTSGDTQKFADIVTQLANHKNNLEEFEEKPKTVVEEKVVE